MLGNIPSISFSYGRLEPGLQGTTGSMANRGLPHGLGHPRIVMLIPAIRKGQQ
jgi:hypothetical protein